MSDESFEATFRRLRTRYLETSAERLASLDRLLGALGTDGAESSAIEDMQRTLHKFAGSGATYGFARVSELGLEGELACDAIRKRDGIPSPREIDSLRLVVDALREALRG